MRVCFLWMCTPITGTHGFFCFSHDSSWEWPWLLWRWKGDIRKGTERAIADKGGSKTIAAFDEFHNAWVLMEAEADHFCCLCSEIVHKRGNMRGDSVGEHCSNIGEFPHAFFEVKDTLDGLKNFF